MTSTEDKSLLPLLRIFIGLFVLAAAVAAGISLTRP